MPRSSFAFAWWMSVAVCAAGCAREHLVPPREAVSDGAVDAGRDAEARFDASDDGSVDDAGEVDQPGGTPDASSMPDADIVPELDAAVHASGHDASGHDASDHDASDGGDGPGKGSPEIPTTEVQLRLAFFGDQGYGANAEAVLQLVKDEQADLVIHAGDFDYNEDPAAWEAQLDRILGHEFPYFAAVGNHDVPAWPGPGGYQELLAARVARVEGAECSGDLGVNAVCRFRGLAFVLSGVGTYGDGHEAYLREVLAASPDVFKLCVWHKNQRDMQVGWKTDEVGWLAYRLCESHGALILTGHEHSYSRTYTLSALGYPELAHGSRGAPATVLLEPGSTAVVVSGLGGMSTRAFAATVHPDISWWATIYANDYQTMNGIVTGALPSVERGVLFIDFHVDGDPYEARAYFKTVSGAVVDSFDIKVTP